MLQPLNLPVRWTNERFLRQAYIVVLLTILPVVIYLSVGEPVGLLQLGGLIEAAHIPVIAWLTIYLNHRILLKKLRPSKFTIVATVLAGLFFAVFATIYVLQVLGVAGLGG